MGWFRRRNRERDFERELRAHLDLEAEEQRENGLSSEEAPYAAQRAFGNMTLFKEDLLRLGRWVWLETLLKDLRFAARLLCKSPGFTAMALLMLGLGIGANTAIFSVMEAVLLRPLPFQDSDRLVAIWDRLADERGLSKFFDSYRDLLAYQAGSHTLEQVSGATWATGGKILTRSGPSRNVLAIPVTLDFLNLLGVQPSLGRVFGRDDLKRSCSVVLAHRFWDSVLGRDETIVGQNLRLDDQSCAVIGVMPSTFAFYPEQTSMWMLVTANSRFAKNPDVAGIGIFARLKKGVSIAAAQQDIEVIHRRANGTGPHGKDKQPIVYPLHEEFTWLASRTLKLSLLMLFAAVAFVLLIACVNTANLLLGRSLARRREMGIRAALGSGRRRLIRQLLTESLLLSIMATAVGALLAATAIAWFRAAAPVEMPPGTRIEMNGEVLAFAAALCIITVVISGMVPAWETSRVDLNEVLKTGGRGATRKGMKKLSQALVVSELTLSLALLAGAGLLTETLKHFASAPFSFPPERIITMAIGLPPDAYSNSAKRTQFVRRLFEGVDGLPGIQAASVSAVLPMRGLQGSNILEVEGHPQPSPGRAIHDVGEDAVSPGYFTLLGLASLQGRRFDARDGGDSPLVAVVNRALVRRYFAHENPLGRHIRLFGAPGAANPWLTIVGVVSNEKRTTVYQEMNWVETPTVYRPWSQESSAGLNLLVSSHGDAGQTGTLIQKLVAQLDPSITVDGIKTVEDILRTEYLAYPRFRATILTAFAGLSLLLAAIGLYGVLSQLVAQRTHEVGVRMALGAQPGDMVMALIKESLALAAAGIALGVMLAGVLMRLLSSLLYGVSTVDPATLAGVSVLLLATALAATYLPARRAASIDPIRALRYE